MTASSTTLPEPHAAVVFPPGDPSARRLSLQIARIAPHFRIALLIGEPGTGKLTVAHKIHRLSPAAAGSFTGLDATSFATFDSGESGHRTPGTLYLQAIDRVPLDAQPALLVRLDSIARHLRVIVTSESDLRGLIASGRMLQPLYERVGALAIRLTPLRERRESIDRIASTMLATINDSAWFNDLALTRLREHSWKANLDELWQVVQHASTEAGEIGPAHLQLRSVDSPAPQAVRLEEVIARHVVDMVQRCAGNKLRAAELLGISRSTLYRMLETSTHN